jgi:hypothetical protein
MLKKENSMYVELKKNIGTAIWTSNLSCWIVLDRVDKKTVYCKEMRKNKSGELVELPLDQREFPEEIKMTILEAYQFFIEDYQ